MTNLTKQQRQEILKRGKKLSCTYAEMTELFGIIERTGDIDAAFETFEMLRGTLEKFRKEAKNE